MSDSIRYRVVELFTSINGEGEKAGECAVFIRLAGCPLRCSYCDTKYALSEDCSHTLMTADEIEQYIDGTKIHNVTLTGGEPLCADGVHELIERLCKLGYRVEIETSGCVDINGFTDITPRPVFTVDYKLPSSRMEHRMAKACYTALSAEDTVKFVIGSRADLARAAEVIKEYSLCERCHVHFSPMFGDICEDGFTAQDIVRYMTDNHLNGVRLQLQIHKFIWDPDKRGV